ncbi:isopentenyl-diphosphate Delta-isomerase I [Physcomitrium patens]|uniref:isopentenyl-diphosphate Delta-isomerase n=1 Tax=Physcomitrium patens TaxID=3218 RepID=A0A2K1LAR1_PHYPA|nr:isopentenyl-diphosphate Delta-isomerase I-like [Physcomitrium patens]PNR63124.1 hypothetical protein PHYPA_001549 [Physcomitrium patens]|eukprot:XP_024379386.1 isopentenyl-diphosphate Delta-isomerase I-like [Physcomitrella patens]
MPFLSVAQSSMAASTALLGPAARAIIVVKAPPPSLPSSFSPSSSSSSSLSRLFFPLYSGFAPRRSVDSSLRGARAFGVSVKSTAMGREVDTEVEAMDPLQRRLMFDDECILVDENDNVVGHDSKYNCHLMEKIEKENLLHRAFSVFLFNSKHELLLQKRSATKVTFPLVWTNTCCSHPLYRESELIEDKYLGVRNAAQRKLYDELGIVAEDVPVDDFTALGRIHYKAASDGKWGEHEVDYLLFLVRDVKVEPNPEEVADVQYVNREQLKELVRKADAGEDGVNLSPWFRLVVNNYLSDWWKRVDEGTLPEGADMSTVRKL